MTENKKTAKVKSGVNLNRKEGQVFVLQRNRKGPIGIAMQIMDSLNYSLECEDGPKKAARRVKVIIRGFKKKDVIEALEHIKNDLSDSEDTTDMLQYFLSVARRLPEEFSAAVKDMTPEGITFDEDPVEDEELDTDDSKVEEDNVEEESSEGPRIILERKNKSLEKPLSERTFGEKVKDEMTHRPGIMMAQMKTKWFMMKFKVRSAMGR